VKTTALCCPVHASERLDGGPILYRCPQKHSVYAADINREFRPAGVTR
jgi:hypothetical protein